MARQPGEYASGYCTPATVILDDPSAASGIGFMSFLGNPTRVRNS
jgi:hypothetical protein